MSTKMRSPQVARKSTCPRELRNKNNSKETDKVQTEILQNVSKDKPPKLVRTIKKRTTRKQKYPVTQSDLNNSMDEVPLNNRLPAKNKVSVKKSSKIVVDDRSLISISSSIFKRPLPKEGKTIKTYVNKKKEKNKQMCKELFDKCDEQVLFKMMIDKFDAEKILQGYKEKRNQWDKKAMIQEAARVFNVNLENQPTVNNVARLESLNKILKELPKLVDSNEEIADMVLKAYGHHLKPDKVFELLNRNEIKLALLKNFTASEFLELFKKTDNSAVIQQILEMASVDAIVDEVKARNDKETSQKLIQVLLEMFTDIVPPEQMNNNNSQSSETPPVAPTSATLELTGAIINVINSKKFLKTSEDLLNFMLKNVDDIISKETKDNLSNFLIKKFSTEELMDLSHAAVKSSLIKNKKVNLIDISN